MTRAILALRQVWVLALLAARLCNDVSDVICGTWNALGYDMTNSTEIKSALDSIIAQMKTTRPNPFYPDPVGWSKMCAQREALEKSYWIALDRESWDGHDRSEPSKRIVRAA